MCIVVQCFKEGQAWLCALWCSFKLLLETPTSYITVPDWAQDTPHFFFKNVFTYVKVRNRERQREKYIYFMECYSPIKKIIIIQSYHLQQNRSSWKSLHLVKWASPKDTNIWYATTNTQDKQQQQRNYKLYSRQISILGNNRCI